MCSKINGNILFLLIMHIARVSLLNILRPTAPCCTISEDQNQWKNKVKAGNDDYSVYCLLQVCTAPRVPLPIGWRLVQLHEI